MSHAPGKISHKRTKNSSANKGERKRKRKSKKENEKMHKQTTLTLRKTKKSSQMFPTNEFYLKSEEQMKEMFGELKEAMNNTKAIADKCNFDFEFGVTKLPRYDLPMGISSKEYLKSLAYKGFEERILNEKIVFTQEHPKNEYLERIEYELSVIDTMGYNDYFLIVWDFINYAKSQNIPVGPGRGSGAGSLVAFLLGINSKKSSFHSYPFRYRAAVFYFF